MTNPTLPTYTPGVTPHPIADPVGELVGVLIDQVIRERYGAGHVDDCSDCEVDRRGMTLIVHEMIVDAIADIEHRHERVTR